MSNRQQLSFKISAMQIKQREGAEQSLYVGVIKAKDLCSERSDERFEIDYYRRNDGKEAGYQRSLSQVSVDKIKDFILVETKHPILPTALLVNSRSDIKFESQDGRFGDLLIEDTLYVIDGQHRFEAWKSLMQDPQLREDYGDYEFPIVILSNFDATREVEQFYVINSRQKRIKTDLAQRNFLSLAASSNTRGLIPEKSRWNLFATKIVDILNEQIEGSVWHNKIILPNDSSDLRRSKIISQSSFISSLSPFFTGNDAIFKWNGDDRPPIEVWADFINEYWNVIHSIYYKAIEHPRDYSIMKTVGVFSLHLLLAKLIKQEGLDGKIIDPDSRDIILSKVTDKLKEASEGSFKLGFWRAGVKGMAKEKGENAGAYSSAVGHTRIVSGILLGFDNK